MFSHTNTWVEIANQRFGTRHRSQVVGIGPSKAWFNCSFFKQAVRWYCLVVDDWLLPKGSLLVCFSHRDKAKLLVFYSHGWSKGMVALKVSWSAVSLYFNGFQLSRTNKWVLYSSKQVVETGINWLAEEN